MKKSIFTLATALFVAGSIVSGCSSPDKKVENAEEKVQDAKNDVKDAKQDLSQAQQEQQNAVVSDFQKFKNESNDAIIENDRHIASLRIDMKDEKREARERDEKRINELEKKNHDLKVKLDAYHDDGKSDWKEFKTEFKHDLDGLGKAFSDIGRRNTK